jgi:hypothetical protein
MGEAESGTVFVGRFATVELDPLCLAARTTTEGLVEGDASFSSFLAEVAILLGLRETKDANEDKLFCKDSTPTTAPRVSKPTKTLDLTFNEVNHTPIRRLSK